ncbi:MAG: hypothetical protein QOF76_5197 [Solirubrobacteraceae bacterium]|jgi:hypothetical protein|nr:hypothetical protein [Solirubrobacteraceae bacterium]
MPDPRELLSAYQDALKGLRRGVGPAGALVAPLQVGADLMGQVLHGQEALETQVDATLLQLETIFQLARDAPAALRTQATAFTAAAVAFEQAAQVMNAQADLLERTGAALKVPARVIRGR